jgi:hypothetical protein
MQFCVCNIPYGIPDDIIQIYQNVTGAQNKILRRVQDSI